MEKAKGSRVSSTLPPKMSEWYFRPHLDSVCVPVGKICVIRISTEMIYLSPYCTWKFVNINEAFRNILGSPSRTLLIYSDVGKSTKVEDQVVDLLREVEYKREDKATVYFEPMHIQYLPVRNEYIKRIQTQVSETNGKLANLQGGHTLLTLHFKRR